MDRQETASATLYSAPATDYCSARLTDDNGQVHGYNKSCRVNFFFLHKRLHHRTNRCSHPPPDHNYYSTKSQKTGATHDDNAHGRTANNIILLLLSQSIGTTGRRGVLLLRKRIAQGSDAQQDQQVAHEITNEQQQTSVLAVGFWKAETGRGVTLLDVGYGNDRTTRHKRCQLHAHPDFV